MQKLLAAAVIAMVMAFGAYTAVMHQMYPALWGELRFQDIYAGLAAFFSGLAFLGVIYAVLLQREELGLQREELKMTRAELKRSAEAQEKSERALSKQAASLKATAKLNGLSSLLQHHNTLIETTNDARYGINTAAFNAHKRNAEAIIVQIQDLIQEK